MNSPSTLFTLMLLATAHIVRPARILTVFPTISSSHFYMGEALSVGLAKAGHEVTIICPYEGYRSPLANLKVVYLTGVEAMVAASNSNPFRSMDDFNLPTSVIIPMQINKGQMYSNVTLMHPNVRRLMDTQSFDLVVVEIFCLEAMIGFGQHFGAPIIGVSTYGVSTWTNDLVGNPAPLSYIPHAFSSYNGEMNLWQRLENILTEGYDKIMFEMMNHPFQRQIYKRAFPNAKVTYDQAVKSVSLVLLNTHFSLNTPRPLVPNMIEVGGLHVDRETKPLPKNIQSFLDSATDGAIYFSLGSIIKSSLMSTEQKAIFVKVFASLKQKVLWKIEEELNVSENVMISSWLPQNDILAHPNTKVFISHGGLLSTAEAIYHGLPIIGMPFFGDQKRNIGSIANAGWALRLDYNNFTEDSLRWALDEMLNNKRYLENAHIASQRFRDQPMSPMQTAVFWTEYVIRHGGAPHLRSASMNLNFVEYHNLDAMLILILAFSASISVILLTLRCCFRKCYGRKQSLAVVKNKKRK